MALPVAQVAWARLALDPEMAVPQPLERPRPLAWAPRRELRFSAYLAQRPRPRCHDGVALLPSAIPAPSIPQSAFQRGRLIRLPLRITLAHSSSQDLEIVDSYSVAAVSSGRSQDQTL